MAAAIPPLSAQVLRMPGNPCPVCKTSNTLPGVQILMADAKGATVTVPAVKALICSKCGVVYMVAA
jgi:YgiT-type zinc finger domain-containing protein